MNVPCQTTQGQIRISRPLIPKLMSVIKAQEPSGGRSQFRSHRCLVTRLLLMLMTQGATGYVPRQPLHGIRPCRRLGVFSHSSGNCIRRKVTWSRRALSEQRPDVSEEAHRLRAAADVLRIASQGPNPDSPKVLLLAALLHTLP